MEFGIPHAKVRRPEPRGLVRERLERRLQGQQGPPIALVLGPPGSGKTTLLGRLAGRTAAGAWYRAAAEDHDEVTLVRHLGCALASALDDEELLHCSAAGAVDGLLTGLEPHRAQPLELVVDDLHTIAGTAAERALERFLGLRPPGLRVTLGSRRPPSINTPRLLANGELCQLDGEDLRFRSWEVEELFRLVHDRPLSPEAAAALTRRTGGWAAGLQLFHLATADLTRAERERAVADLTGRSRLIRSYLARNVLDGLEPDRRRFLLHSCTLGVLTGELCDELLGTVGSAAVLAELERQQFFTTSTDGGLTFRYHQVLQTHLEVVLVDELGSRGARALYTASGRLLERDGRDAAAARAYARGEDWASVSRLLRRSAEPVSTEEDWARGLLGPAGTLGDDPSLLVAGARRLLRSGLVAEAVQGYRHAESLLDDPEFRERCARERAVAAVWLPEPAGSGAATQPPAELRQAAELRLLTRTASAPVSGSSGLVRGLALLLGGDLRAAARVLERTPTGPADPPWQRWALRLLQVLGDLLEDPSDGGSARLEEVVLAADAEGVPWLSRLARGLQAAALLATRADRWRVAACADLLEDAERHGDPWAVCLLSGVVGAAHRAAGHPELAAQALRRSAEVARELHAPVLEVWAETLRVTSGGSAGAERGALQGRARALGLHRAAELIDGPRAPAAPAPSPAPRPPAGSEAPADVQVRCLGWFEITVGGSPVPWTRLRPRAQALLQLLALHHGRRQHREHLVDALWPDATLASGTRSLQVAVSSVRQCLLAAGLHEGCLSRQGDGYVLELPGAVVQLQRLEELAREAGRQARAGDHARALATGAAALELYAGDLLPEAGPADWVVHERDRVRTLAAELGAEAARSASAAGELAVGVRLARRSLALDPYQDPSWRLLVDLLERLGDRSAALRSRRDHAETLAELGLPVPAGAP